MVHVAAFLRHIAKIVQFYLKNMALVTTLLAQMPIMIEVQSTVSVLPCRKQSELKY